MIAPQSQSKVILITGASSGIGRACAEALAARGHRVYGANRSTVAHNAAIIPLRMNVTDATTVTAGIQTILDREGQLDVAVNNSGAGIGGAVEETSMAEAQALLDLNFFGVMRVCQAVLPIMRAQGAGLIINMSSVGGLMGLPYQALYSASKYALEGFSESLRMEVAEFGIRVVLVEPGDVNTAFTANRRHAAAASDLRSPYAQQYGQVMAQAEADERVGVAPERVARTVLRVVNSRHPRTRYVVGPLSQCLAAWIKPFLPAALAERLLMAHYGLESPRDVVPHQR